MSPGRPVLIAGSTTRGEDQAVIRAFNRVRTMPEGANALLIIAARHPERFDEVERLCKSEGLSTIRRSELPIDAEPRCDAVVLDTIVSWRISTRLRRRCSSAAAWCRQAGTTSSNRLSMANRSCSASHGELKEIAETFLSNRAAVQVHNARELETAIAGLIGDPVRRARLARRRARSSNRREDRTLAVIGDLLRRRSAAEPPWVH